GKVAVEHRMRAFHRLLGALLTELFLRQAGDDDRQFVRRQRVGVVQYGGDGQVFAADRPVDDDLQPLDRGEHIHRAPIATGAIVIEDQHRPGSSSALRAFACLSSWRLKRSRKSGRSAGARSQIPAAYPSPTPAKKSFMCSKRALLPSAALTT